MPQHRQSDDALAVERALKHPIDSNLGANRSQRYLRCPSTHQSSSQILAKFSAMVIFRDLSVSVTHLCLPLSRFKASLSILLLTLFCEPSVICISDPMHRLHRVMKQLPALADQILCDGNDVTLAASQPSVGVCRTPFGETRAGYLTQSVLIRKVGDS